MSKLITYLPGYYRTSAVMVSLTDSEDAELQLFRDRMESTLNQFFVDLADTSLDRWEKELGIPNNALKPVEYRRSVIKSKLIGSGTVTAKLIKSVAMSFSNGETDVIENNLASSFTIKFVGTKGIPPNLDDLKAAIEEIKPAHLEVVYEIIYNTIAELEKYTIGYLRQFTIAELKNADLSLGHS